jgi:thiol-disulfide isomerase/thioredoxin
MNRALRAGIFIATAGIAAAAGFYFNRTSQPAAPAESGALALMRTALVDLGGKPQQLEQWRGKVLVVNFWATWCVPCREEIPALLRVQKKHVAKSVKIVGIALDNVDKVREYAAEMKIDYAVLIGSMETMAIAKDLGNRAGVLPYTVVLDRTGKVAHTHAGALTESALDAVLGPLI